jgi:hypothetical protein
MEVHVRRLMRLAGVVGMAMFLGIPEARAFDPLLTSNRYDYVVLAADTLAVQASALPLLHPSLRSCVVRLSEVTAAFPGNDTAERIRAFVLYAYRYWRIAPTYLLLVGDACVGSPEWDLVPTHLETNPFDYPLFLGQYYADDGYYVSAVDPGQVRPLMHIGRLPARRASDVATFCTKMAMYQAITGEPPWLGRILLMVGDADYLTQLYNATYSVLSAALAEEELGPTQWNQSRITTKRAAPYYNPSYYDPTPSMRTEWNWGYGFVNALGNTRWDVNWFVFLVDFNLPAWPPYNPPPTFTGSLSATGYLPVVFASTCYTNYFHYTTSWNPDTVLCVGEDLLLTEPSKGAIAVVGPSHMEDIVEAYAMNRTFVHEMVSNGVRNVGRLYTMAKTKLLVEDQGHPEFAGQYALLGDPALDIKLWPLPTASSYACGAEIEESPVLQDSVLLRTEGISGDNLRVVDHAVGLAPLVGERMLSVLAQDALGTASAIEWKLQDLTLPITRNMVLSYWMNLETSPSANGHLALDGNTTAGRLRDRVDVFTVDRVPLDAKQRPAVGAGWKCYYADLSPLEGATLLDLRARYESTSAADSGRLVAYVDDIRVRRYEVDDSQELVNPSFEEDANGDGTPDFWTNLAGESGTGHVIRSRNVRTGGDWSMCVIDLYDSGEGARQIFTANSDMAGYTGVLQCYAADPTTLRIRIRDLEMDSVAYEAIHNVTSAWESLGFTFSISHTVRPTRFSFELMPMDPGIPVYVDDVDMDELILVDVGVEGMEGVEGPRMGAIGPNPMQLGSAARIEFELPRAGTVGIAVFDVGGRRIARFDAGTFGPGRHSVSVAAGVLAADAPGLFLVRMSVGGEWGRETRKIVVVR